jgi:transcriptional regulator with XRE-family HTH domain
MKIAGQLSDDAVLKELGARLARVRLDQNLTQADLAAQAGVSKRTVERLEAGAVGTQLSGFIRICRALGLMGRFDVLVPEPLPSPIALLKLRGKQRRRASGAKSSAVSEKPWTWGGPS